MAILTRDSELLPAGEDVLISMINDFMPKLKHGEVTSFKAQSKFPDFADFADDQEESDDDSERRKRGDHYE